MKETRKDGMGENFDSVYKNISDKHRKNSLYRNNLIKKSTVSEKYFMSLLDNKQIKYKFQRGYLGRGWHYIVDFYIKSLSLCIEIDGGYHQTQEQKQKDYLRDITLLVKRKKQTIRYTKEEIMDHGEVIVEYIMYLIEKQLYKLDRNRSRLYNYIEIFPNNRYKGKSDIYKIREEAKKELYW